MFGGWLSRHISVLGWCDVDLCCNDHGYNCVYCTKYCDYCTKYCDYCTKYCDYFWNRRAEPGWNMGIQHG
jgi:hypothetical protein